MLHTAPLRALGEGLAYQVGTMWLISLINGWLCDRGLWITYRQSRGRSAEATEKSTAASSHQDQIKEDQTAAASRSQNLLTISLSRRGDMQRPFNPGTER